MKSAQTRIIATALVLLLMQTATTAQTDETPVLQLEAKIPLGNVNGRIDHMAVDLTRQRLLVAELGNDSIGVVDLNSRSVIRRIEGFKEPQGIAYLAPTDTLYVANGGDGSVRLFRGTDYANAGQIDLGDDADNIRVDSAAERLLVGYGAGGLAVIDLSSTRKIADIPLSVHPESFQLDPGGARAFVNLPKAQAIAVVDRTSARVIATWPMTIAGDNFAMVLTTEHVLAVFRRPSKLGAFSKVDGALVASSDICGDADDIFIDEKRQRIYVSCGEGFIDVLDMERIAFRRIGRIPTVEGARTSLFVPELDRLMLAVRAASGEPAAVWVFRPIP